MTTTRVFSVNWGASGATLYYRVLDGSDASLVARTHTGITESPAGSGLYRITIANWDTSWTGRIVWDDGTDFADESFEAIDLGGPSDVTLTFHDSDGEEVPNVDFIIVNQGSGTAGSDGTASFGLPDGDYVVVSRPTNGVLFDDAELTVNGTTSLIITGNAAQAPTPPPGSITIPLSVINADGSVAANVIVNATCVAAPDGSSGLVILAGPQTTTSDDNGTATLTLIDGAKYSLKAGTGRPVSYIASESGAAPVLIGQ